MPRFNQLKSLNAALTKALASQWFFYAAIAIFVISAGWIALSNSFPMHFDENYHLGVIDIYANHPNPLSDTQPDEAKYYGDITTLTSYLYHYIMSFPYQLAGWFTESIESKIIFLRLLNVAMVAGSLVLWRRLLLRVGISRPIAHLALLAFISLPIVPLLAAHINYDNLTLLLIPLLLLITHSVFSRKDFLVPLILLVGLSCLTILVKYTMLPVVAVLALAVIGWLVYTHRSRLGSVLSEQFRRAPLTPLLLAGLLMVVGIGLVGERYVGNVVTYRSINPSCEAVQSEATCSHYSVWVRNTAAAEAAVNIDKSQLWNPLEYSYYRWVPHIFNDFFVIASFASPDIEIHQPMPENLQASAGNPVFRGVAWALFGLAVVALLAGFRYLPPGKMTWVIIAIVVVYGLSLWWKNYTGYQALGLPFATQGRYLVPFVIPFVALSMAAMLGALSRFKLKYLSTVMVVVLVVTMVVGAGGVLTYIVYSGANWQWDFGHFREWNTALRDMLSPLLKR